jgi:hypothetical protein
MTNKPAHPTDMRSFIEILDEASLADVASNFGNAIKAAVGDKKAQGAEKSKRLARHLKKTFNQWLGQSGKEADEESVMRFLVSKVGFTAANARKIMAKANIKDPTKNESIMEEIKAADLDRVFLVAAQFAYEYDLVPDDDDDDDGKTVKNRKTGSRYDRQSRYGSSYQRSRPEDDFMKSLSPKEVKNAEREVLQRVMPLAYKAGLEDEHIEELAEIIKSTKGRYEDINTRKDKEDVNGMLARLGYAYLRSQQKD